MGRGPLAALAVGVVACAACCAGPLIALLTTVAAASALGAIWRPALGAVAAASAAALIWLRRRRTRSCPAPTWPAAVSIEVQAGD